MQDHDSEYSSVDLNVPHHTSVGNELVSGSQTKHSGGGGILGADEEKNEQGGHTEDRKPKSYLNGFSLQGLNVSSMLENFIKGKPIYRLALSTGASADEKIAFSGYRKKLFEAEWNFIDLSSLELIAVGKKEAELPMLPKSKNLDVKRLQSPELVEKTSDIEELEKVISQLDASDARIREHQAVTKDLGENTRRGLSELEKLVSSL